MISFYSMFIYSSADDCANSLCITRCKFTSRSCTLFKACILNETDTLLWLPYLIYDGSSTITESEKYSTEIIMIH